MASGCGGASYPRRGSSHAALIIQNGAGRCAEVSEPVVFAVLLAALFIIRLLYLLAQQQSRSAAAAARARAD